MSRNIYTIENSKFCSHGPSSNPKFITFGDLGSISNKYISEFSFRDTVKARIQSDPTGSKHKLSSSCPIRWWYTVLVFKVIIEKYWGGGVSNGARHN